MSAINDRIWVINKDIKDFSKVEQDLGKLVTIKAGRPVSLPKNIALKYVQKYRTIELCENPREMLRDCPINRLVIRDAGLGDLLLLEPVLRSLAENGDSVSVLTRFPEIYENNPNIANTYKMENYDIPSDIDVNKWDTYEDLRHYSETCPDRHRDHRTDCYNQVFQTDIKDKEPRIYTNEKDKLAFKKKKGAKYIGIACDGSHFFRRYSQGAELIDWILKADDNNHVVIVGDGWEDGGGYVKEYPDSGRVQDLQGKTTVRQVINVIKNLDALVAVDTGLMHIALSMHIPTVCIFSIIAPDLRIKYYTGKYEVIYKEEMNCIGCGSWHMAKCKFGDTRLEPDFVPPCLHISPTEIMCKLNELFKVDANEARIFKSEKTPEKKKILPMRRFKRQKLTMPIITLNEEKNLPRFIELVVKHPNIGRVIAIDGGSTDKTVELLQKCGAEVYIHPYDVNYHDMQAMQRNYSFSFVRDGEKCIMMDIDECFSDELSDYLEELASSSIIYGLISRRTFDYFDDINDPTKQIKDYPDWQPRYFTWNRCFKWVGSPHHNVYNVPSPVQIKKDIIHFEKENKDRDALEDRWSEMQRKTREIYA